MLLMLVCAVFFSLTLLNLVKGGLFGVDKKMAFNVWDFAGQLEYLTTHQFFITVSRVCFFHCYTVLISPVASV